MAPNQHSYAIEMRDGGKKGGGTMGAAGQATLQNPRKLAQNKLLYASVAMPKAAREAASELVPGEAILNEPDSPFLLGEIDGSSGYNE